MEELRREYRRLLEEMSSRRQEAGELSGAVSLFMKVTKSYWKGLFRCYRFPKGILPRTNNDLEHLFAAPATMNGVPAAGRGLPRRWW